MKGGQSYGMEIALPFLVRVSFRWFWMEKITMKVKVEYVEKNSWIV